MVPNRGSNPYLPEGSMECKGNISIIIPRWCEKCRKNVPFLPWNRISTWTRHLLIADILSWTVALIKISFSLSLCSSLPFTILQSLYSGCQKNNCVYPGRYISARVQTRSLCNISPTSFNPPSNIQLVVQKEILCRNSDIPTSIPPFLILATLHNDPLTSSCVSTWSQNIFN